MKRVRFLPLARLAACAADDKKARDVALYDVRRISSLADYYLVATVESGPHLSAVEKEIDDRVKTAAGLNPVHREGRTRDPWFVLDYGGVVIHLFQQAARAFYGLERLWEGARPVAWAAPAPRAKPAARRRKK